MSSFYGCGGGSSSGGSGPAGVGIKSATINEKGELIFTYTNGLIQNLGVIKGVDGATFTPIINNNVLSWTNNAGLENPESLDFNQILKENNEGDYWQDIDELVDTLGWGNIDTDVAAVEDINYYWGTF